MERKRIFAMGGFAASAVLVAVGITAAIVGYNGRNEVRDTLRQENIIAPADSTIPGQLVDTGAEAKAQAEIMRHHQLETSQGLTYAEMGRFAVASGDAKGTNDATQALKDANGNPVANSVRASWVTETALTTSLNTAFFAEQVGVFSMVVGFALLLSGLGFAVLTAGTLWQPAESSERTAKVVVAPVTPAARPS